MIFDGRDFAEKEIKRLGDEVIKLTEKLGRKPCLATIYNPEDKASRVYTEIKATKANELGIAFEKYSILNIQHSIIDLIIKLNNDPNVDGIMIQTPLIDRETDKNLYEMIEPTKDCDGLNPKSGVVPATVKAVLKIFELARGRGRVVVVGQRGLVGKEVLGQINNAVGMSASQLDENILRVADVIISATGYKGLIKSEMVKEGAICIDVGYPGGDFDPSCLPRASFFTPVPGGVGPVTVACLFENLVKLVDGR